MMDMLRSVTAKTWLKLLALAAFLALAAAYTLQYGFGFEPCQLCYWQRYPYMAVIAVAALGVVTRYVRLALLAVVLLFLADAGIAFYHLGVEQGVFALPSGCLAGGTATTIEELRAQLSTQAPACDQVSVSLLGLSLSAWNGLAASFLALASILAMRAPLDRQQNGSRLAGTRRVGINR
jgi:disulfide bond formation protein DsbB